LNTGFYTGDTNVPGFFLDTQQIVMSEREQQPAPAQAAAADAPYRSFAAVRLMPFWSNSPAAWFRAAEAQFVIREVTDPLEKFYVVLTALTESNVDRVRHIMEAEPDQQSYQNLKDGLVASYVMSDYEKIDKLVSMQPLNGRKPSDLLVEMERLKPSNEQQYFAYHFLQLKLRAAKEEFSKMLAAGVVRRSSSCWASPFRRRTVHGGCVETSES
jgi:hypothetical protein